MEYKAFEQSIIQDNKLLSLCRRLKNFTREDLLSYLEIEEETLDNMLLYLIDEGNIEENVGGYSYVKSSASTSNVKRENKNLHYMFQFHSPETIELLIKSFCLGLQTQKTAYLLNLNNSCIADFYTEFRKLIYERQHKILLNYFFEKPQIGRYRIFFEQYAYFYIYNNQVFVTDKLLKGQNETSFNKAEIKEFKKVYCYLSRIVSHNKNEVNLYHNLAEYIWRKERTFEDLYQDLKKNLLNIC